MNQLIPSKINPGQHFAIDVWKSPGRPAYAVATEGTCSDDHGTGFTGFSYVLGQNNMHRVLLVGNNTPKNRYIALAKLMQDLSDKGWIEPGHTFKAW